MFRKAMIAVLAALSGLSANAESVGIVDFGAKLGSGMPRGEYIKQYTPHIDRDNNGTLTNDFASSWYYSDTKPLNPNGLDYDTNTLSGTFYGGLTLYTVSDVGQRNLSEGHINQNHEFYDDFNLMSLPGPRPNELLEAYAVWYWTKEGFLNGGAENTVTFDTNSQIAVEISRYWGGVNAGRWLVRDGNQFYLSEDTFAGETQQFYVGSANYTNNTVWRNTHIVKPMSTKWAPYTPMPNSSYIYEIDFNHSTASFSNHTFTNVTAVGFFIERYLTPPYPANTALTVNEPIAVKWNSLRAEAVVNAPAKPAINLDMADIGGTYFASNPVPYQLWRKIFRFAVRRQYVEDMGIGTYSLEKDGSMGMMRADGQSHNGLEPVTDMTWYDAAAWCNALSEFEGKEPCYYTDASYTNILRVIVERDKIETWTNRPTVYWNTNATGFRLPTAAEWSQMTSGLQNTSFWEYVWNPSGAVYDPASVSSRTVLNGNQTAPTNSILTFSEHPWEESPRITFRPVRNGTAAPLFGGASGPQSWSFSKDTALPSAVTLSDYELRSVVTQLLAEVTLDAGLATVAHIADRGFTASAITTSPYSVEFGATEIPYSLWNFVAQWAMDNEYSFNYPGDMGSMGNSPGETYMEQTEPVTRISWYDIIVWCNALSEIMGREPVYYKDLTLTNMWKQANEFRLETCLNDGYPHWPGEPLTPYDTASYIPVFMDTSATGYRMPLPQEWNLANVTDSNSNQNAYNWLDFNSSGKTHRVATKLPNPAGLYDMEGNVREFTWGDSRANISSIIHSKGSHFARGYQKSHPALDVGDLPSVGRVHVGFRTLRLTAPDPVYEGINVSAATLSVVEGSTNTFMVTLSEPPPGTTTVTVSRISGDADIAVSSGAILIFTTGNWNAGQVVMLVAAEDSDGDNGTAQIRCAADGIAPALITVTEQDNDASLIASSTSVTVNEGGSTNISLSLTLAPPAPVTVTVSRISGDTDLSVSGSPTFVFDSQNWNQTQTLTIAAAEDGDQSEGSAVLRCSSSAITSPVDISAKEIENDFSIISSGLLAAWNLDKVASSPVVTQTNAYFMAEGLVQSVLTHNDISLMLGASYALKAKDTDAPTIAEAITAGKYLYWRIAPQSNCVVTVTSIVVRTYTDTPVEAFIMSEASGLTESDVLATPGGGNQLSTINLSGQPEFELQSDPIEFRVYGYKADNAFKAVYIGRAYTLDNSNDILVYGTVAYSGGGSSDDEDSDGLPDEWETLHFGGATNASPSSMAANGINTIMGAYIAGLDPTNSNSKLLLNGMKPLMWNSASGRVYNIYWTSNLINDFTLIQSNLTGGAFTDQVHGVEGSGFYRIDVMLAP